MKKWKKALPLLALAVLLLSPGILAEAADTVKLEKGTAGAEVTLTVSNMQSFEGEFTCTKGLKIESAAVQNDKGAMCQATASKVFMAGSGDPVKTVITLKVTVDDPQKDAVYTVSLTGSGTDSKGVYPKKISAKATVTVGNPSETEESKEEEKKEEKKEVSSKDKSDSGTDTKKTESNESDTDSLNNAPSVNYEELKKALSAVNDMANTSEEGQNWKQLLNAMYEASQLLNSGSQEEVDEATAELNQLLTQLQQGANETEETEKASARKDFRIPWRLILPLVILIPLALAAGYYFWKKRHPKAAEYEGAPMVEYDIEDDDMEEP